MPFRYPTEIGGQGKPITEGESEKIAQDARWRSMIKKEEATPALPLPPKKKILPGTPWELPAESPFLTPEQQKWFI